MKIVVTFLALSLASAALHAAGPAVERAPALAATTDPPATLEFWNREITTFRATLAGLTPAERMDATLKRMRDIPHFALYKPVERVPVSAGGLEGVAFEIDGHRLFALAEADLDPEDERSFDEVTAGALGNLEALRQAWLDQRSFGVIAKGIGLTVVATVVFGLVLYLLKRLGILLRRIFIQRAARFRKLKRKDLDLRPVLLILVRRVVAFVIAVFGFAAGYVWLTSVLGYFPYTAPWSDVLGGQLLALMGSLVSGLLGALPGLVVVIVIFFLTRGTVRIVDQLLASLEQSEDEDEVFGKDTARATRRIAGLAIWIAGVIIAYPYIPGSDSPAFKGIGVLLGLMVSIGSSGFVNQLMSGFVVLYSGAVRSGEFVRVGDVEGTVADSGLLSTTVRTPKKEYVSVPNAVIVSKETHNYTRRQKGETERCQFSTTVTIGYDAPWRQVHELLLAAAARTPGIRKDPAAFVLQTALSDFYVEYELRFVPSEVERRGAILSELHQRIQDAFHDAGVQIMSPNFESQPEKLVLPPDRPPASV